MSTLPDRLGRYRILGLLGEGGMGSVHCARDEELGRDVAIKVIQSPADPAARARFKREARAACALHHPNVATIFDVGESDGAPYIVMELVRGTGLRSFVGDAATPLREKVRWLLDVGSALQAAHDAGFVHRDMKPENVVIGRDGVAKILDFGIAKAIADVDPAAPTEAPSDAVLTRTGATIGTPAYMSPEQIRAEPIDPRADQFAWGVTAFEVLAGRLPWARSQGALALAATILTEPPQVADSGLHAKLVAVLERCLAKRADDRFPSMKEACVALRAAHASDPPSAEPFEEEVVKDRSEAVFAETTEAPLRVLPGHTSTPDGRKRGSSVALAAGGLVLASIGGGWFFFGRGPEDDGTVAGASAPTPTTSSSPLLSASAARDPVTPSLPARCRPGSPAEKRCDKSLAWCNTTDESFAACCVDGLSADVQGRCVCPPGGTTKEELTAQGCKAGQQDTTGVRNAVDDARPDVQACYDAALKRNPKVRGKLAVRFEIGPDGRAYFVDLVDVAVPDPDLQDCVREAFVMLRFAPPADGSLGIRFPYDFVAVE